MLHCKSMLLDSQVRFLRITCYLFSDTASGSENWYGRPGTLYRSTPARGSDASLRRVAQNLLFQRKFRHHAHQPALFFL